MSARADMMGQTFGRLTVTGGPERDGAGRLAWRCSCTCGREVLVNGSNLRRGLSTSCGCARGDKRRGKPSGRHDDLTGQTYGELTAVAFVRHGVWRWRCSCGAETEARAADVRAGRVVSCGHVLRQRAAERIDRDGDNTLGLTDGSSASILRAIRARRWDGRGEAGHVGVSPRRTASGIVWRARIVVRGQEISLGTFGTLESAINAREAAEHKYFDRILDDYEEAKHD